MRLSGHHLDEFQIKNRLRYNRMLLVQRCIHLEVGYDDINVVPPVRPRTHNKSTVLVQSWPQVYVSTVEVYPAGENYFFPARHFFGNLSLLGLALSLRVPGQPTRW